MNHENEVTVRWTMPGRHVQLRILPYNKYRWPIAYSLTKTDQTQKLNAEQWPVKMRSRSNKTYATDIKIIKHFHTPNIVDLLHIVLEKKTKTQKVNVDHWTMKMRSRSDYICQLDMYTLQSCHTPNIVDLLHTV